MRWIVISLVLFNAGFLLWNWLGYSHAREVSARSVVADQGTGEMPGARLQLLREQGGTKGNVNLNAQLSSASASDSVVTPSVNVAATTEAPAAEITKTQCVLLGPVVSQAAAKLLLDRLLSLDIHAKFAAIEIAGEPDFWVYLKPEATRELAVVKLHELQEKKIDSFIIPQGEIANGISLGVFDRQDNAESRRQVVAERGYDAQIRINSRTYVENWVVVYPEEASKFSQELYIQLHAENNKLDLHKDQCSKVASVIDIH